MGTVKIAVSVHVLLSSYRSHKPEKQTKTIVVLASLESEKQTIIFKV